MNKILYDEISSNDNLWRVVQALIDKQGEPKNNKEIEEGGEENG